MKAHVSLGLCTHKCNICKWKYIFLCHGKGITNIVIGEDGYGAQDHGISDSN